MEIYLVDDFGQYSLKSYKYCSIELSHCRHLMDLQEQNVLNTSVVSDQVATCESNSRIHHIDHVGGDASRPLMESTGVAVGASATARFSNTSNADAGANQK